MKLAAWHEFLLVSWNWPADFIARRVGDAATAKKFRRP
jgi:hypothetical protein